MYVYIRYDEICVACVDGVGALMNGWMATLISRMVRRTLTML